MNKQVLASSFRDPAGFLFTCGDTLYRQVNESYRVHYDHLMQSGLYAALVTAGLLIPHTETAVRYSEDASLTIAPEKLPFISYPYEWCFSQLKDAALATLTVQQTALQHGMILKDASAYNIQFRQGKPVLIDTLSFEKYTEGRPWAAYGQFCRHFAAPLVLMSCRDIRLNQLLRVYLDGIPLDLASTLLPASSWLRFNLLTHIHLHAGSRQYFADKPHTAGQVPRFSRFAFAALIDSLAGLIKKCTWRPGGTTWADYYSRNNYQAAAFTAKKEIVAQYIGNLPAGITWDLGANTGAFSRIAAGLQHYTVAFDLDAAAVELNYLTCKKEKETGVLPLVLDLTNPSAAIGWQNGERLSLLQRGPADTVLALALLHHLAIGNNLPFNRLAEFFAAVCTYLVIEFIPKEDSQVERMLATREDIFSDYTEPEFEKAFSDYFLIKEKTAVSGSLRTLYLMQKKI